MRMLSTLLPPTSGTAVLAVQPAHPVYAERDLFAGNVATTNVVFGFLTAIATAILGFFLGLRALRTSTSQTPPKGTNMTTVPAHPAGSNTVNPFIMTHDASGLIAFVTEVFGAVNVPEAHTADTDGLILHSELLIGDSMITITDRKPGWPFTPAFTRVYVDDVPATLARAEQLGARVVTQPTEFFGDVFSRFQDTQGNLWWVYHHNPATETQDWGQEDAAVDADQNWESFTSPELEYIHATLLEAMAALKDPRAPSA